jgi:exopolysaccharide biosynthesis polyprenyl glycosylphosphotransferase
MLRRFSVDFAIFMMIVDAVLVSLSLAAAVALRPGLSSIIPIAKSFVGPYIFSPWQFFIFSATWVLMLVLFSAYDGRKNFRLVDEQTGLALGSLLAAIATAGLLFLTFRNLSRALFGLFVLISYLSLLTVRLLYRNFYRFRAAKGLQVRRVLIIGSGHVGKKIALNINDFRGYGLKLIGYLDDDPKKLGRQDVLGTLDDARRIITEQQVDDVVMALPQSAYPRSNQLAIELHDLSVRVWVVLDYFSLALNQARFENFANIPMIDLRSPALNDYQLMIKRVFDICISVLALPFVLPFMGIIALIIRIDSPGPVIFRQKRVGDNGRPFEMLKFRTMVQDADQMRQVIERIDKCGKIIQNKNSHDSRITRVGIFLRKTSLDELPQFINVLRGEMSLVGPRPELPYLVDQYEPWQRARFSVPQGITGWWQVNGRSDKPMQLNTQDDLYYIKNYSIWLDIKILFKTIWAVIYHKGAY